jgi:chemotaxis response regulator CheB
MAPNTNGKTRILIIDDSSFMRMAIRSIITKDLPLK